MLCYEFFIFQSKSSSINTNRFDYPATAKYCLHFYRILFPETPYVLLNAAFSNILPIFSPMYMFSFTCSTFNLSPHNFVFFLFRSFLPRSQILHLNTVFTSIQQSSQDAAMYKYIHYYFTHILNENTKSKE